VPRARAVGVADCPVEPKQGVPIASGDVSQAPTAPQFNYGYRFLCVYGKQRDIWHFLVASNGAGAYGVDICLTLYNPSAAKVFSGCSNTFDGDSYAVMTDQTLTATGTYTIDVTEASNGTLNYGLSLERDYPTPLTARIQLTESSPLVGPGRLACVHFPGRYNRHLPGVCHDSQRSPLPEQPVHDRVFVHRRQRWVGLH